MTNDQKRKLLEFCTSERQTEAVNAWIEHGSQGKAATALGVHLRSFEKMIQRVKVNMNSQFVPPHDSSIHHTLPDGYAIKGVSNMVENSLGKPMWVKTEKNAAQKFLAAEKAIDQLLESAPVREEISVEVSDLSEKLLNQYTFTDYHIGMLAWHREGGDNWNAEIAEKTLKQCFTDMIQRAPKAKSCVINQLGDYFHFDSMTPETPTSGHPLDSDTRAEKMVECAINSFDYLIAEALRHHETVYVVIAQGNHDLYSSIWLRKMFMHMYKNNERLVFIDNSLPFYALEWGVQMLGYHHGHKVKFDKLPSLFADQFREMYGRTKKTAIHMGHYHHQEIKEVGTTVVEMHRTLAARDSHASYGGYHSERASDVITYHRDLGEVSRCTVRPALFGDC